MPCAPTLLPPFARTLSLAEGERRGWVIRANRATDKSEMHFGILSTTTMHNSPIDNPITTLELPLSAVIEKPRLPPKDDALEGL